MQQEQGSQNPIFYIKVAITHLIFSSSPQNVKNIEGHKNWLGLCFEKKSVTVIVLKKSVWHTKRCMHASMHTHTHTELHPVLLSSPAGDNNVTKCCWVTSVINMTLFFSYGSQMFGTTWCQISSTDQLADQIKSIYHEIKSLD